MLKGVENDKEIFPSNPNYHLDFSNVRTGIYGRNRGILTTLSVKIRNVLTPIYYLYLHRDFIWISRVFFVDCTITSTTS